MPDFTKCVRYKDRIYCWNKETRKIAVVEVHDLDFKECPECVIEEIIMAGEGGDCLHADEGNKTGG
ncbi:MAG: hypothetical protein LBG43_08760 [Treponema sp.]|jgi:hypothetical protein|nr:hypothetical protein [Treponema sp.]